YKYYGNGVKPRRMEPLWYPNALQGETPMEPTAQWFAEHSACGNDLYCVDKVTYEKLVLDTDPPGTTYQHVHVRVKLRRR
ncbi:MAG TPA: hypothetical protein PLV08_14385, partial [Flavobacteriales bacterium]|nr:hypothetical protein [Flavobacteriales bacterium]